MDSSICIIEPYQNTDNNIWSQILESDQFSFNKDESSSFQQDVFEGQENLVLLFDGYDELKQKYRDKNLNIISSNQLFKPQLGKNVKVIYTSRIETLNYEKYTQSFLGNNEKTFTQAEIICFEESQIDQYLEQYCIQIIRQKLYCNSDKFIQNSQNKNSIISINNFKEIWEIFLLEDIQKLLKCPEQNKSKQIITDELLSNLFYKLQRILECEDISFQDQQEFRDDFKTIQSPSQIMKQIANNQIQNLIQTPQSFKIILSVLQNIDKLLINKKTRFDRFRLRLQKLKTQEIKSNKMDQQIDDYEYVQNLMKILEDINFFDDFSVELLNNQVTQLSNQDKDIIKKAVGQSNFTLYQFYKLYVAQYHEWEIDKVKNSEQDFKRQLYEFQMRFAVFMSSYGLTNFPQKKLKKEGKTHFKFKYDYFDKKKDFFRCALIKLENSCYFFLHKQIQEFFVGKYILRLIKDFQSAFQNRPVEKNIETSSFNQDEFNLSFSKFNGELNMIKVELENYDDIKNGTGEDLKGIQLQDTNISGLNFFGSILDKSKFENVQIFNCNFNNASLKLVEWTKIPKNNVEIFKSKSSEIIEGIRFSPNNKILVSWDSKTVYIWNLQTKKIKKELNIQKLESCIFSSDSSKILLFSQDILSIYLIDEEDIKLLMSAPQYLNFPFSFYNNQDTIISFNYQYNHFQVLDLRNQSKQKSEWFQQIILDKKDFPLTSFNLFWNNEVLLGTEDGSIFQWDILGKSIKPLFKNVHKSQIIQIQGYFSLQKFRNSSSGTLKVIKTDPNYFKTEYNNHNDVDQVIIYSTWKRSSYKSPYKEIKSLPSLKVNGQLPRYYFSQNSSDLILFKKDHIIFYDQLKITSLKEDKIFINCNCLTEITIQQYKKPELNTDFLHILIAKDNCIEFYKINGDQKMIDRIPLDNFKPISIQFCLSNCIISYNQDETIRFWYMEIDSSIKFNPIGLIKGQVKNLKQAFKIVDEQQNVLQIAIQTKNNQIDIQNIQIQRDQIISKLICIINCTDDSEIGCYSLFNDVTKICITIEKIIQFRIFESQEVIKFKEIHNEKIKQICLSTEEQYLVSCSMDNNIIIWNVKNRQAIYFIKDQICVDLLFISILVILQTQKSIIFYKINIHCNTLTIIQYFELEQSIDNQNLQYTMSLLVEKSVKYLVIKSGQNMVMKHLLAGDQTQIFNQFELSSEEVVFINKDFLIQKTTQNSLKIIDLNNMEEQTEIKYNIFTIQEPKEGGNLLVPLIAIETNQIIQIFQLMKENNKILLKPFVGEIIIAQDNQTNLAFSDNSYFFAYSNKQSINIYQIKSQQIVKLSTINIDFEVKKIELSNFQNICILSQDRLIFYNNFQVIETIDNFHKHTDLEDQDVKTNTLFTSLKLNHNDKLLALQFQDHIYFQTLSEIDSNNAINKASKGQKLYSNMFSTSIDNKTFAILDQRIRTIKYYDFDWKNIFQPLYILEIENEQNLLNIQFINDPNSILVIYPDNIQIWNHKSQKKEKSIEGSYNFKTQVSINTDVAVIVYSKILINKNIKSRTTYQQQFLAKYPHFTSDGQYIVFEKNNVEIMFQSLQDPKLTYTFKICNKENFLTLLPQSNLLITFDNRRFYFNFWDASILDNINLLHKIPILDNRENCKLYKQLLISKNNKNVYCIYNLKELINNSYDNILDTKCSLLMMCPNETKYCKVDENKISIWNLKERVRLEDFIGHFEAISAVNFTQDEKYMVSVDRGGLIIVWNMLNHQNIKIDLNKKAELVSCKFMNIQDSLGITCMIQNEIVIFDLKNFESYEIYHRIPTNQQYEIIDQNVFSKGNKLAISYLIEKKRLCIRIFKVDTKEIIENITISYFQIFICSINSEEYFIKDKKEQYISVITQETNHFWMYNWSLQFLEIYNFNSSSGALPIYRIFLPLNSQDICRYGSLKRVRVGNKYLTYYYEDQFRIIDLELYKQQVYFCVFDNEIDFKGQLSEDTLILFQSDNQSQSYNLINYKSDQQQIQTLFNTDCNQFILAFSNNGQYCAQGWNLGHIRIFKVQNNKKWSKWGDWNSKQKKIDCLIFIQNDEILISSQYNELSFWNMKQETIQKGTLIQEIKIDFKIEEIVDSHNGYIALSLEGGIIQIITIDQSKCNIENENYKKQYFGCYRSFPQLYNIQTQNCIIQNSIIKNQDNQSILHLFSNQEIKEFESGFNNEETDE